MPELFTPGSADEVASILKRASEEGKTVECAGARTRFDNGNGPGNPDIILSSAAMNRVSEYEPADLVIGVESGATLPQISAVIAPNNQFLALDPAVADASTIGAITATASAGPLRFAHGTPRDQVLGLEVVTGDGRVLHFGGRVVKNVAGYDVVRLIVGSRGTLGFITKLHLRLKPRPQVDRTIALAAMSFAAVADAVDAILDQHLEPAAIEITNSPSWTVLVRYQGNAEAVAAGIAATEQAAPFAQATEHDASIWQRLAGTEYGAPVKIRLANLRSHLRDTATVALRIAQETHCSNARLYIHAGEGIVRLLADTIDDAAGKLLEHERAAIQQSGGSLIIERGKPLGVDAFGHTETIRLMKALKQIFDPAGILGMSRFEL